MCGPGCKTAYYVLYANIQYGVNFCLFNYKENSISIFSIHYVV